jgi:diguanylate cyclase (GGDEF)-like protein
MIAATLALLALLSPLLALAVLLLTAISLRLWQRVGLLRRESEADPLTGLPNRRGLARHWDRMAGEKALLFLDLDGFKAINDRHGHVIGDALLRTVASRLAAAVAPPGLLARWGGDEFVALVPAERAERQRALFLNAAVMGHDLSPMGGPARVGIGVSIGVACGQHLEDVLAAAVSDLMAGRQVGEQSGHGAARLSG